MKISSVETNLLHFPLGQIGQPWRDGFPDGVGVLIGRIKTDEGLEGIGLASGEMALRLTKDLIDKELREFIIGEDPRFPDRLWKKIKNSNRSVSWHGMCSNALSIIDTALWDITAKSANLPLYQFIGGFRDRVPVYASWGLGRTPAEELLECYIPKVESGFTFVKLAIGDVDFKEDLKRIEKIQNKLGNNITVLIDAQARWNLSDTTWKLRELEKLEVGWVEEPMPYFDLPSLGENSKKFKIPIVTGENISDLWGFRDLIATFAVGVLQPDPVRVGGITPVLKIGALAEAWNVNVAPHTCRLMSMHLVAGLQKGYIVEYLGLEDTYLPIIFPDFPKPVNGFLELPKQPGLGVHIDETIFQKYGA
jgi:D-arabinonate dehydratase